MDPATKAALIALKERGLSTMMLADMAMILMMEPTSAAAAATPVPSHADKMPKMPVDADAAADMIRKAIGASPATESPAKESPATESPAMAELKAIGEAARAIGAPAAPMSYAKRVTLVADKHATGGAGTQTAPSKSLRVIYAQKIKTYYGIKLQFKSADDLWWALRHITESGWYSVVSVCAEKLKINLDFNNATYLMREMGLIEEDEEVNFFEEKGKAFYQAMMNVIAEALKDPDVQKAILVSISSPHPKSKWGVHASKAAKATGFGLNPRTGQIYFE
jgi:hypothetical protein